MQLRAYLVVGAAALALASATQHAAFADNDPPPDASIELTQEAQPQDAFLDATASSIDIPAVVDAPVLTDVSDVSGIALSHRISREPLLGGGVTYQVRVTNTGADYVTDRGYNLTLSDTLPADVTFNDASIAPTRVLPQKDGTTVLHWDNIVDLEAGEGFEVLINATLNPSLTIGAQFTNTAAAQFNTAPDNSGTWRTLSSTLAAAPQAIDAQMTVIPSSSTRQATGAGEYSGGRGPGPDWAFQYQLAVKNNAISGTDNVLAQAILPSGVAYLGNPTISPNPNAISTVPTLTLQKDGSLLLNWNLGNLGTAQHASPVVIRFDAAIPYKERTQSDTAAALGAFAGPMSGEVIPEDDVMSAAYEATGTYAGVLTSDGTTSTPYDDSPARTVSKYVTLSKTASTSTVNIGTVLTFTLRYAVSEYYNATNVVITDTLPDGLSYLDNSTNLTPTLIEQDTPSTGRTTIRWNLADTNTTAGRTAAITFRATVNASYKGAPYANKPVVSGDALTNLADIGAGWQDIVDTNRVGTANPNPAQATVNTRMPTFGKEVFNPLTNQWQSGRQAFTGDTAQFRLSFATAPNMNARGIVVRDFIPRGMTYVQGSAQYNAQGAFGNGTACVSAPTTPIVGTLSGLQYLEWRLCDTSQNATWTVTFNALIGDAPDVQPDWLVGNFGKLSGLNTYGRTYSQRGLAMVDYIAPKLILTKFASPESNLIAGNNVYYTVTVTNVGEAPAYNLVLQDTLPAKIVVANSGGSATPSNSSYGTVGGSPNTGDGGVIQWANVASLAVGATQTYYYNGTVKAGVVAGESLTNLASVGYNSRADNTGHATAATANVDDDNTDDHSVYVRGLTYKLGVAPSKATLGDVTHWTLTVTVPPGVIGYWPVAMITLPDGLLYITGTQSVTNVTVDAGNHALNPLYNGSRELRFFFNTIDNSASGSNYVFTVSFDALVTGFRAGKPTSMLWNACCQSSTSTAAYVGWYDSAAGYNSQGFAWNGFETNYTSRIGSKATASVTIRQPSLTLTKAADHTVLVANDTVQYAIQTTNVGYTTAFDVVLTDTLPAGLTLIQTTGNTSSAVPTVTLTDTNSVGSANLSYALGDLPAGATWRITFTAKVDAAIAAGLTLTNNVRAVYSSQRGTPGDVNADGVIDEQTYSVQATNVVGTILGGIRKSITAPKYIVYGNTVTYKLLVPPKPINATMYNVFITDTVDSRLQVTGATNGTANGNIVTANFASIAPNQQKLVTIQAVLPSSSSAVDGAIIPNVAQLAYSGRRAETSNSVSTQVRVPALVVSKYAGGTNVKAGDTAFYTITVANVGTGPANTVRLSDTLPTNMSYIAGSATLNGQPLADPTSNVWSLPDMTGVTTHTVAFHARVNTAITGTVYINTARAIALDSAGQPIPANNKARVAADIDADDISTARLYGPMTFTNQTMLVAFEDQKRNGWSDWDYNDFVVRVNIRIGKDTQGRNAVIKVAYETLARGAGFDHNFRHKLPVLGGGRGMVTVLDANGALVSQTNTIFGDKPDLSIIARTRTALPPPNGLFETNTSIDQTEYVKGYSATLDVVLDNPSRNTDAILANPPWDAYIYVIATKQEVHLLGPGRMDNTQTVNGKRDPGNPMIGYDLPLAQTFPTNWDWPLEFIGIWRGYPLYANNVARANTTSLDWNSTVNSRVQWVWAHRPSFSAQSMQPYNRADTPSTRYFGGAVVANLDGVGPSIIVGNLLANRVEVMDVNGNARSGWPAATTGGVKSAPVVADINNDGSKDIVVGAEDGMLYAWNVAGTPIAGFPVRVGVNPTTTYRILATPAIADLDQDGKADIVVPLADGRLYAINSDGSAKWNVSMGDVLDEFDSQLMSSAPMIADVNGDGWLEIAIGSTDKNLYLFNHDGTPVWTVATGEEILSTPAVADLLPATPGQEIVAASGDGLVYVLDKDGNVLSQFETGWSVRSSPLVTDIDGDGGLEVIVGSDDNLVWAWHADGTLVDGWPQATTGPVLSSPVFADVDGDGVKEIVVGSDDGKVYAWHASGMLLQSWPRSVIASVKGKVAIGNLDGDAAPEVVVADLSGTLTVWGGPTKTYLPHIAQ